VLRSSRCNASGPRGALVPRKDFSTSPGNTEKEEARRRQCCRGIPHRVASPADGTTPPALVVKPCCSCLRSAVSQSERALALRHS
jgi:hypothetical protein